MPSRFKPLLTGLGAAALVVFAAAATTNVSKWPPRLSYDAPGPVNSADPAVRGAVMLIRGAMHEGVPQPADFSGAAEGLVNGARRTIPLRFEATRQPGVVALRRQWPDEGVWAIRVSLRSTINVVTLGADGTVASVLDPREGQHMDAVPTSVIEHGVDSILTLLAKR